MQKVEDCMHVCVQTRTPSTSMRLLMPGQEACWSSPTRYYVCVSVCVFECVCAYVCVYVCEFVCKWVSECVCKCVWACVCEFVCVWVSVCVCVYGRVWAWVWVMFMRPAASESHGSLGKKTAGVCACVYVCIWLRVYVCVCVHVRAYRVAALIGRSRSHALPC